METVARRIAQIVEDCSGEGGKPRSVGVRHCEGRTSAMDCIVPNLRTVVVKKTARKWNWKSSTGNLQE